MMRRINRFQTEHPVPAFFITFAAAPVLLTGTVFAVTFGIMYPVSLLLGWF